MEAQEKTETQPLLGQEETPATDTEAPTQEETPSKEEKEAPGEAAEKPEEKPEETPKEAKKVAKKAAEKPIEEVTSLTGRDGKPIGEDAIGLMRPLAKELGIGPEKAQKVWAAHEKLQSMETERLTRNWEESSKKDSEVGGKALSESVRLAKRAMAKYGTPELQQWLGGTPLGSHPEIIRFLSRVGKAIAEDTIAGATGHPAATAANSEEAFLRKLYPTMFSS